MLAIDQKIFDENLLLTQRYCEMQLGSPVTNNASVLRSFNPVYQGTPLFSFSKVDNSWDSAIWSVDPVLRDNEGLYNELFIELLKHKFNNLNDVNDGINFNGRILVAEIDTTVKDGASEAYSDGFIDINDCPPIDTWFYKASNETGRIFYAWIPERFIGLTQNAIDVNMLECFTWQEDYTSRQVVKGSYSNDHQMKFTEQQSYKRTFIILILLFVLTLVRYLVQKSHT